MTVDAILSTFLSSFLLPVLYFFQGKTDNIDTLQFDAFIIDTCNIYTLNIDIFNIETLHIDTFNNDTFKFDIFNIDTLNTDILIGRY